MHRVLLADDDERIIEAFTDLLEQGGFHVLHAADGFAALSVVEADPPDLVLLDVVLPGKDGIAVCRAIKTEQARQFLPVVLMTGLSARDRRLEGLHAGADDFLNKPIDPLELMARVRSLLRIKSLYDEIEMSRLELERRVEQRTVELRAAYDRLQELSKAKDNALAIVAHELRTPLHQARSALSLALKGELQPEERQKLLKTLEDAFLLLEYRIEDISLFSDPSDWKAAPISVSDLLSSAIEQVTTLRRKQILPVTLNVPSSLPAVRVDGRSISRTLAHIIDNGLKFSSHKEVTVTASESKDGVVVIVSDKGVGMTSEEVEGLFDPLRQGDNRTTRRYGGLGIGLALIKTTCDAQGIPFLLDTKKGEGTTVRLTLPVTDIPRRAEDPDS